MQIVIDIKDDDYYDIIGDTPYMFIGEYTTREVINAVKNGTPLPKGHGDLIDRSKIYKAIPAEEDNCTGMGMTLEEMDAYNEGIDAMYRLVKGAKPIIDADKEKKQ